MKVICKDKWSYSLQSQVVVLYHSEQREREKGGRKGGEETPQEKKAEHAGKRGVCSQSDFVGERFLPRFLTQGRR